MAVVARYPGQCYRCGGNFPAGTKITNISHSTRNRWAHEVCPPYGAPHASPSVPQPFTERELHDISMIGRWLNEGLDPWLEYAAAHEYWDGEVELRMSARLYFDRILPYAVRQNEMLRDR